VALAGEAVVEDVSAVDTWTRLESDTKAQLIDVRTRAEWGFVGVPDLSALGRRVLLVEWQTYPDSQIDPAFGEKVAAQLTAAGVARDADLFFICRTGGRSRMAASAMTAAGYVRCHNVADGFEGPLDAVRHRGKLAGWKSAGLPWVQG
jgi:rhodanese-related sulfurtransferase